MLLLWQCDSKRHYEKKIQPDFVFDWMKLLIDTLVTRLPVHSTISQSLALLQKSTPLRSINISHRQQNHTEASCCLNFAKRKYEKYHGSPVSKTFTTIAQVTKKNTQSEEHVRHTFWTTRRQCATAGAKQLYSTRDHQESGISST